MRLAACQRFDPDKAPSGWTIEPIKNRLRLEYGSGLIEAERNEGDYPVYGSNGQVGTHDKYLVECPGILVGRKGSVGEVHFSENSFWPIDTVYYVRRLKEDNWRFLYYLLTYLNLGQLNAATGVPGLTRRDAHFILGAFPPPNEEDEIANIIKLADEAITAAEAKLAAAQRLKTSLMQQLFTRGIPGRHTRFQQTKVGEIPKGWELLPLGKLATIASGIALNTDRAPQLNPHQYLTVIHVQRERLDLSDVRYLEVFPNELPDALLEEGDILVVEGHANASEIGRAALATREVAGFAYQNHIFRIRLLPDANLDRLFLLGVLNSERIRRHWVATCNTSSGLNTINRRALRKLLIQRPPTDEQEEMAELLSTANETINACESELQAINRLKRSLLQNLLTGRVRVRVES